MNEVVIIGAAIVLAFALGAETAWLTTRTYYKKKEREREHNREKRLLQEIIRTLSPGTSGEHHDASARPRR